MNSDPFQKIAHLYLGLSRQEFARRVRDGLIDCEILKAQIAHNSHELQMEAQCESVMQSKSFAQMDKFSDDMDSSLS